MLGFKMTWEALLSADWYVLESLVEPQANSAQELKKVWVNIYDLIDAVNANTTPQIFPSLSALRAYTLEKGKIFPKKEAKKGGPVKSLLAHIFVRGGR